MDINGDNAGYILRSYSILEGKGFKNIYHPYELYEATLKSIGYSIILLPFIAVFKFNSIILNGLSLVLTFGFLYLLYIYFNKKIEKPIFFLVFLFTLFNSQIIEFSSMAMTENVFLFFLFMLLVLTENIIEKYNNLYLY